MSTAQAVAVITGASRGIGAALVQAFRKRNYCVVATSRSIKPCRDEDLVTVQGDVADPNTADRVFKVAFDRFGHIDTLVNNAGMFLAKPFTSYSNDDYATYIAINVTGFFHMTQRALQLMSQAGRGHVVTVSSSLVDQPMSSVPAVLTSLTKGALNAATKALAIENAKNGVRVNAVSAGIIKTPMHQPETHPFFASLHPLGRMGEISEIVDAILYLESANFVTGEILHVDGGQAAGHYTINAWRAALGTRMEPGKLVPLHSHIDPECFYLLEGQIDVYVVDDAPKWRMVETGHSYLVSNGVKHAVHAVFTPPTSEDTPKPTDIGTHRRLKAPR